MTIETPRLRLSPASRETMEGMIASEADPDLRAAYGEMLEGCLRHPDEWEWYAAWTIALRDGTGVGDLCFKGPCAGGAVEIGYGILEAYRGRGYAAEAVGAAVRWALARPGVDRVEAETEPGNLASQRVLEKCGFRPTGGLGKEGPRFFLPAQETGGGAAADGRVRIREERVSAGEYVDFLKRSDLGSQYPKERFEERIERLVGSASISLTARDGQGSLVGVLFGLTDYAYWLFVTDLGVDRAYERQGIGRKLMQTAHRLAGGEKDVAVYLVANENAVPFYEKLGMKKAGDVMQYNHVEWTEFTVQ